MKPSPSLTRRAFDYLRYLEFRAAEYYYKQVTLFLCSIVLLVLIPALWVVETGETKIR